MIDPRLNANPKVDEAHHRALSCHMQWADAEAWCRPGAAGCMQRFRRSGPCPCRKPNAIGPRQRAPC
jgi:hypothetical protein